MSQSRFYRYSYAAKYGVTFALAVAFVLDRETEFNADGSVKTERDPSDPGGTTKYGIDAGSHPGVDVENLSEAQAVDIYWRTEWARIRGDGLPCCLALSMLDTAVNPGIKLASVWLQLAVGATPDGIIGDRTLRAAQALGTSELRKVAADIQSAREHYYRTLPDFKNGKPFGKKFRPGWLARVEQTRTTLKVWA